jgi:hypothetical protein
MAPVPETPAHAVFYSPIQGLRLYAAGTLRRLWCGLRTGHDPDGDEWGYGRCLACGTWLT